MFIRDLNGNEYPVQATTTWDGELNGNQSLSATIAPTKVNLSFLENLSEMWVIVDEDETKYKIVYCKKQGAGNTLTANIKAIPLFFDDFNRRRIYERYDQSFTALNYFSLIFNDSGYDFVLVDAFSSQQWEGVGEGSTRLEMFKDGLNRYKAEFRIEGNTIYLENQIGIDSQFRYEHRLNASNIVQEIDASELWTYAKGYGDYGDGAGGEDWQNAKLVREYTSPLAELIDIREAPPIKNGNITTVATMDEQLKTLVDESLKISVSANVHDLRKQGYPIAQSNLGDRVFLIDHRIGFDDEVRIVNKSVTKNWKGEIIDMNLTFGTPGLSKRHQSKLNSAADSISNLLEGKTQLPFNALDNAVKQATEALHSAQTELSFENGIIAVDPSNPNNLVLVKSNGIGVSRDGGATFENAITYLGVNTNLLTAGSIFTNNVKIVGEDNYFYWDGNELIAINPQDTGQYTKINSQGLYAAKGALTVERPDEVQIINNGIPQWEYAVSPAEPPFTSGNVTIQSRYWTTDSTTSQNCQFWTLKRMGRYLNIEVSAGMVTKSGQNFVSGAVEIISGTGDALATQIIMSEMNGDIGQRYTIRIDFGTPQLNAYGFYMRIRSGSGVRGTIWARKVRIWMDG